MHDLLIFNSAEKVYKYFIDKGLTTLPEYWNFEEQWGTVTRSLNHAMMGHVKEWFTRYLAGINPIETAYNSVEIKPSIVGGLATVDEAGQYWMLDKTVGSGKYTFTIYGSIPIGYERWEASGFYKCSLSVT